MYIFIIFILIFIIINFSLTNQDKKIEGFRRKRGGINIGNVFKKLGGDITKVANKAGGAIKNVANKAGGAIKNVAEKVGSEIQKVIPIPKASYVPKTYAKKSYGIGVGQIPLTIIMRPLKPGVKISKVKL